MREDEVGEHEWFTCECGYKGRDDELVDKEDTTTLYCPICGSPFWIWD